MNPSLIFLFLSLIANFAFSKSAAKATKTIEYNLQVPNSTFQISSVETQAAREGIMAKHQFFADFSQWQPSSNQLNTGSVINSDLSRSQTPKVNLAWTTLTWQNSNWNFAEILGFGYTELHRTGLLPWNNQTLPTSQDLHQYQLQYGLRITNQQLLGANWSPVIQLALTPAWIQGSASAFGESVSVGALATEGLIAIQRNFKINTTASLTDEVGVFAGFEQSFSLSGPIGQGSGWVLGSAIYWN